MDLTEIARGKWEGIFRHFGIKIEPKKQMPCPMCGGNDRFIFDNKQGRGTFFCRQCGAGTGYQLISRIKNMPLKDTIREVKKVVGTVEQKTVDKEMTDQQTKKLLNETWKEATEMREGDPAWTYLHDRTGWRDYSRNLRFHPTLWHQESRSRMPSLIAKVTDQDNKPVSIHRTYLTPEGKKAHVPHPKMLMAGNIPDGSAVRLASFNDTLGIAEGIETALSAHAIFGIPVWAAISAPMLVKWKPPPMVSKVVIFGDADHNFVGQSASYRLAQQLHKSGEYEKIEVVIPSINGADWNDVLMLHGTQGAKERWRL